MKKIINQCFMAAALLSSCHLFAGDKPSDKSAAKAIVNVTIANPAKGSKDQSRKVSFSTVPGAGLKINEDGPWKLEIKNAKGLKFSQLEFKRDVWNVSTAGFETTATLDGAAKFGDIQYKMTTFVCTVDKSMCYREVVEGKATLTL